MVETIYIKWDTGHMTILLDAFFPATKDRLKKLLTKVIRLDWENQNHLREILKVYFQEKKKEHQACFENNGNEYLNIKQKAADLNRLVESRKRPNGVPLTNEEWKQSKADLKKSKAEERRLLSVTKEHQQAVKQFEGHLEILQAEIERWGR